MKGPLKKINKRWRKLLGYFNSKKCRLINWTEYSIILFKDIPSVSINNGYICDETKVNMEKVLENLPSPNMEKEQEWELRKVKQKCEIVK